MDMYDAASRGDTASVKRLLLGDVRATMNAKGHGGRTPVFVASENGHAGAVNLLVDENADLATKDDNGRTPIFVASENGHFRIVNVLAARSVDLVTKDKHGRTPAFVASEKGHLNVLKVLVEFQVDMTTKDGHGRTPILVASNHGHLEVVNFLVSNGADTKTRDNHGRTPAFVASENGHLDVLKVLVDNGAKLATKDHDARSPALVASENGHVSVLQLLAAKEVDIDSPDNRGRTPALAASENGHLEIVKVLMGSAAIHKKDDEERTPAFVASENGHLEVLKVLLDHDADVDTQDCMGRTLAFVASENGHLEVLKFLFAKGADLNKPDNDGRTLADVASHGCAKYLVHLSARALRETKVQLRDAQSQLSVSHAAQADLRDLQSRFDAMAADMATLRQQVNTDTNMGHSDIVTELTEDSPEASLVALLKEVRTLMDGPGGWASPPDDPAADARRAISAFFRAREALSTLMADVEATAADPAAVAQRRADCCAAATALLKRIPFDAVGEGIPVAPPRPPQSKIGELADVVAAAEVAHKAALASVTNAVSSGIPAVVKAASEANSACAPRVESIRATLTNARAAVTAPTAELPAEECRRQREAAEAFLEAEAPWAGDVGLQRRRAASDGVPELVARRAAAQKVLCDKDKRLTLAKATVAVFPDDQAAQESLHAAEAERAASLPELLSATAAVQDWATSGEGALALKAFPGDTVLKAALDRLFETEFTVDTALPPTPGVVLDVEYPYGLAQAPVTHVYYAAREISGAREPVVLRRLRLDTQTLIQEAQRQLRDAGRIAVGLQACPDAAAGFPAVVKATRWFLATGPGGATPDAWLEFPRAQFGSLAEILAEGEVVFTAAGGAGLCLRLIRAVAQLHAAGIRHGDLNPSNVVLWDDPASDVVRPGIIDLLDTAIVGETRTLRGATMGWLPPEALAAVLVGEKAYGTCALDCWQLGRICEAVVGASSPLPSQLVPIRAAVADLCAENAVARSTAAAALRTMEATVAGASAGAISTTAMLQWVLPPGRWLCQRGAAPGVDFVELCRATDPAAVALIGCAMDVGRCVRAVYRLENLRLWRVYAAERARVAEEAQGAPWPPALDTEATHTFDAGHGGIASLSQERLDGTEMLLLHGASGRSHRLIAEGGFDPSYSGDNVGALFGAATCLTPSWEKAANGYAPDAGDGVFVTRVAVGRVADCMAAPETVTSTLRRPPHGHHSVLGDNGSEGAVVAVYRPSQMYPEYLVVFGG